MAEIKITNQTEPATPSSGVTTIYVDDVAKSIYSKDDAGVVTAYGTASDINVKVSANDTTTSYLSEKLTVGSGTNSAAILETSIINPAGDEDFKIQIDSSKITSLGTLNSIQLNTGVSHSYSEGLVFYDNVNKTLAVYNDEVDAVMQVGQEIWIRIYNNTGSLIDNGKLVYLNGVFSGFPTVALAKADDAATCLATIGMATHSIEDGTYGYITRVGTVRDLDTSGCSSGAILYLSETSAGDYTETKPSSPNYVVRIGNCSIVDASNGTIEIDISIGNNTGDVIKIFNGATLENTTFDVTSDGSTVTASLEKVGGGNINLFFDGGFVAFDSTPAATVTLTAGTDTVPVENYVFIPQSTMTLTANTTGFPTEQHAPIGTVVVQSAASAQIQGIRKVHAWTDHLSDSNNQGHLSHINKWIRNQNATWLSGVGTTYTPTVGGGSATTIAIATASGSVLQLHSHTFPAFDTSSGSDIHIVNDPVTAYKTMNGLVRASLTVDSSNVSLVNRYYTVVIWGVVSEDTGDCHLMLNLPSGSYGSSTTALQDASKYANYSIPSAYKGTGFLITQCTLQDKSADSTLTVLRTTDLRGTIPSAGGGGGTTVQVTEFSDANFKVFNNTDNTKQLAFSCAGITTGTTRTLTVPDISGTVIVNSGTQTIGGAKTFSTGVVINEDGNDADTRIEGDTKPNLLYVDAGTDRVGINTDAPDYLLTVSTSTEANIIGQIAADSTADYSSAAFRQDRSRGTIASKTIVQDGDWLGGYVFRGYDGTAFRNAAAILAIVNGAPGAGDMPGALTFSTTPDGNTTASERMRITQAGYVGIGTTDPGQKLTVSSGNTLIDNNYAYRALNTSLSSVPLIYMNGSDKIAIGSATGFADIVLTPGTGNVGIGITSPQDLLDVNGRIRLTSTSPDLRFYETDGSADENWQFRVSSGDMFLQAQNDAFDSAANRVGITQEGIVTRYTNSSFRATRGTAQTISASTYTKIQYNTETYDVNGDYDNVTNFRFTAPTSGKYLVRASVITDATSWSTNEYIRLILYKNGAIYSELDFEQYKAGATLVYDFLEGSDMVSLTTAETLMVYVFHNRSVSLDIAADAVRNTFSVQKID